MIVGVSGSVIRRRGGGSGIYSSELECRSEVYYKIGAGRVGSDELGEGRTEEGGAGIDGGEFGSRGRVGRVAVVSRFGSERGDEVEGVENEEGGDL